SPGMRGLYIPAASARPCPEPDLHAGDRGCGYRPIRRAFSSLALEGIFAPPGVGARAAAEAGRAAPEGSRRFPPDGPGLRSVRDQSSGRRAPVEVARLV